MASFAEIAYAGYCKMRVMLELVPAVPWDELSDAERNCWDAAAQAVLHWADEPSASVS